jgi:anti-anti-sigma factor
MNPGCLPTSPVIDGQDPTVDQADGLIVEVRGAFDLDVADRLRQPLLGRLATRAPLVAFDLCDCAYVDSAALGLISDAHEHARDRCGALALICPDAPHPSLAPLRQSGLDSLIQLFPSRETFEAFMEGLEGGNRREVWKVVSGRGLEPTVYTGS